MNDLFESNQDLLKENSALKQRIQELEKLETERKRDREAVLVSGEQYRILANNIPDIIYSLDGEGNIIAINSSAFERYGFSAKASVGKPFLDFVHPDDREILINSFLKALEDKRKVTTGLQFRIVAENRLNYWFELNARAQFDSQDCYIGEEGVLRDITERKRTEEALIKSEEKFRKAFLTSPDSVNINRLEDGVYVSINDGFTRITGYTEEDIIGKSLIEHNIWENNDDRHRLVAGLKKDGEVTNFSAAFCTKDGQVLYGLMSASMIELDGVPHILSITRDITKRRRAEEELQRTLESLRKAFSATVQVMVSAVEARDPYTAGHQIRTADLARSIATELGLPQSKIDAIRMAASIHDIGKLSIPAELLSSPKKLSAVEFALIKEHSRSGYEILKDVESPWPLAEIIYQHHERMNGTGYPRNLQGEDILIEARIITVSDVVESMASHRPYRPSLGIDAALEEIEKNQGILYDTAVTDACLKLFREKGYKMKEA